MNQYRIALQTEKLNQEREQILLRLAHLREAIKSEVDTDADEGDFEFVEHELTLALTKGLERKLESIDDALRRVQQRTYGICERCGASIDPARLEAVPETAFCLPCRMIVEGKRRPGAVSA